MDGFSIPSSAFDMSIVERVEVVKGAASMLYGQGSLGGFVNIVRKKPKPEPFLALTTQAGSFNTYRAELDVNGAIDPDESFAGRLTTAFEDSGSFIHGVGTQTAVFAPSFEAVIDDDTRALIQVVYQRDEYIPSQGVPLKVDGDKARAPKIPRSWFIGIPSEEKSTADNIMATLRLDHEITDRWLASLAIQGAWQNAHRYFDSYGYDFGGLQTDTVNMTSDTAHIENQNWAGELRIDGAFDFLGQEHRLLAGIEKNRRWNRTAFGYTSLGALNIYDGDFDDVPTIPGGAGNQPFDRDSDFVSDNQAVYGQLLIGLTERTRLLAGIRYDDVKQERFDNIAHDETGEKEDDAITLRFGLSQDFTDNITGYALYSQSFNPVEAFSSSGAILDPETGESYEVGVKTDWLDGNLAASLALFQQELDNRPIPDPDDPANFSISGGLERTRGIEFELAGTPYPGVTIGASAAFLDAKVVDKQDDNYGLKPYSSVDRIIGFYASYEFQEGPLEGLGLGTTVVNMGDRSASFAGNAAQFNNGTDELYVPGYTRWDLSLFYNGIEGVDLSFQVRNVLDEVYIERFRDVSGSNYFGSPRAYLFRGHVKF
jgi:TonB-dependent siderophore receptor